MDYSFLALQFLIFQCIQRVPYIVLQWGNGRSNMSVIAYFTTHGESHFYGLPCPSVDSLDPMDHFCTFDISKIIPKNMKKFPYSNFNTFLTYIRGFDP